MANYYAGHIYDGVHINSLQAFGTMAERDKAIAERDLVALTQKEIDAIMGTKKWFVNNENFIVDGRRQEKEGRQ